MCTKEALEIRHSEILRPLFFSYSAESQSHHVWSIGICFHLTFLLTFFKSHIWAFSSKPVRQSRRESLRWMFPIVSETTSAVDFTLSRRLRLENCLCDSYQTEKLSTFHFWLLSTTITLVLHPAVKRTPAQVLLVLKCNRPRKTDNELILHSTICTCKDTAHTWIHMKSRHLSAKHHYSAAFVRRGQSSSRFVSLCSDVGDRHQPNQVISNELHPGSISNVVIFKLPSLTHINAARVERSS